MQQAFIEHYNQTLRNSEDPVLFMDAVHPTQSTKLSYGWTRKGQDKVIETTGSGVVDQISLRINDAIYD